MNHDTTTERTDDCPTTNGTNAAFEALRTRRRRVVLRCLADSERVEVAVLATEVAARVTADGPCVEATLRHVDLPKLSALGFVEYDRGRDVVRSSATRTLRSLLAVAADA